MRGEVYYASHDYFAARRDYRALVDRGTEPRFQTYFGRALARLVDVALRLKDPPETLAALFEKFNLIPPDADRRRGPVREGQGLLRPGFLQRRDAVFTARCPPAPRTRTRVGTSSASSR